MTQPTSRLALARQGDPEAIAGIIRDSLRPSFDVKGNISPDNFLEITLETDKHLDQNYVDDLVKKIEDYVFKYFGIHKRKMRISVHSGANTLNDLSDIFGDESSALVTNSNNPKSLQTSRNSSLDQKPQSLNLSLNQVSSEMPNKKDNEIFQLSAINFLATLVLLGFIGALILNFIPSFPSFPFRGWGNAQVGELVSSLFFTILIVERSLEVFVTTWRGVESAYLKQKIVELQSVPAIDLTSDLTSKVGDNEELNNVKEELARYKAKTSKLSLWAGLLIGILTSFVGIRILETFIDVRASDINEIQLRAFRILDIFLTGGLIAGGSKGFHQIMSIYEEFMEATTRKIKDTSP
jgi:hypothetical protein